MLPVSKSSVRRLAKAGLIVIPAAFALYSAAARSDEAPVKAPAPASDAASPAAGTETAVLAGGCFWGMESVFEHVRGVKDVVSGYAGGSAKDANYDAVSSERTGHAEAIRITYDPSQVTYGQLLQISAW